MNEQLAVLLVANPATEKKDRERRATSLPWLCWWRWYNLANVVGSGLCLSLSSFSMKRRLHLMFLHLGILLPKV
jgi:hypothetical protein